MKNRFPKDPIARDKWIRACDLLPSDNLKSIYICSMHFSATDIDRGNQFQTRCTLKRGAVPSINVPNKLFVNNENIDTVNNRSLTIMETNKVEITSTPKDLNELENIVININTMDVHNTIDDVLDKTNTFDNAINTSIVLDDAFGNIHVQELGSPIHISEEGNKYQYKHYHLLFICAQKVLW